MGRSWLVLCLLGSACVEPQITHCPTVDCPGEMRCDGQGGCALPEQLAQCAGQPDGMSCGYTNQANQHIDGACADGVCLPIGCGNGKRTPNEVCDDGNTINGDGCAADCQSDETCGNSVIDPAKAEQCDDGNLIDGDGCQQNCRLPRCGDGIQDDTLSEQCDAGAANSAAPDAACRPNCQTPRCGDGVADTLGGEVCDDGNNQSADGCSGDCRSNETCGNGVTDALDGEICDDGNTADNDGCSADCASLEVCGDGIINSGTGEICDDDNTVSGDGCSSDCKSLEVCPNGVVDTLYEQCDLGAAGNSNAPDSMCRTNCKLPACGDTIIDPMHGEQCDDGLMNAQAPDACRTNCQNPRCGDGVQDTGEVCDDGDTNSGDGCSADCLSLETCGNGIVDIAKGELCDAGMGAGGNSNLPNAPCRMNCRPPSCGDNVTDNLLGEGCDNGIANSINPDAACRPNCQPRRCGDNIIDTASLEVCDDGNATAGDNCSADCRSTEICGNSIVDVAKGEQCDAGTGNNANTPNAACRTSCQPKRCGDNIIDTLTEVCDDSNTVAGDGCSPDCASNETCGNGIVDFVKSEQCDDSNPRNRDGCSACRPEAAIVLTPGAIPTKRDSHLIVYDGARQRVVMYGGWTVDGNLADTWEWDGISWTQIRTAHSPGPRLDAAFTYDAARHRVLMFGGYSANYAGFRADTWEYDGVDWTLRSPATSPPPLAASSMAYDPVRRTVVLYGGDSNDVAQPTSTWEWNGTTWTRLFPVLNPGARQGHRMATDAVNDNIVLVGGGDNHTWTWNGVNWTDKGASAIARTGYDDDAIAFDASRQLVVLWDGTANVTWAWDGNTWASVASVTPTTPRSYVTMTYDAARAQMVLYGGYGNAGDDYEDTWLMSGVNWALAAPFVEPTARFGGGATYDPMRKRVVMFGGRTIAGDVNQTWEWDGRQWLDRTAVVTTPPAARNGSRLAYNSSTRTVMAFGGLALTDLFNYDGSAWTPAPMSTGRTAIRNTAITYDSTNNRLLTFAGRDDATTFNVVDSTHQWTAAGGWLLLNPTQKPPGRKNHGIAYDPVRQRTVMFGGVDNGQAPFSDVWEYNGATWSEITTTVGPPARAGLSVLYNPDAQRAVVFGNAGGLLGEDLWEWTGTGWNQRQVVGTIPPLYRGSVAYDTTRHVLVTFGGRDGGFNEQGGTHLLAYWPNQSVEACTSSVLDYDNDGKLGCADEDCWSTCTPLCPPGTTCPGTAPRCGDGTCQANENCGICPADCGVCTGACGDFHCDTGETTVNCPNDC